MTTPHDLKTLGLPTQPAPMSNRMVNFCLGLCALIAVLSAYALVADEPDRKVVDIPVSMTTTEFAQALDRARKQGEADTLKRLRACDWRDSFRTEPPLKKWSKT